MLLSTIFVKRHTAADLQCFGFGFGPRRALAAGAHAEAVFALVAPHEPRVFLALAPFGPHAVAVQVETEKANSLTRKSHFRYNG